MRPTIIPRGRKITFEIKGVKVTDINGIDPPCLFPKETFAPTYLIVMALSRTRCRFITRPGARRSRLGIASFPSISFMIGQEFPGERITQMLGERNGITLPVGEVVHRKEEAYFRGSMRFGRWRGSGPDRETIRQDSDGGCFGKSARLGAQDAFGCLDLWIASPRSSAPRITQSGKPAPDPFLTGGRPAEYPAAALPGIRGCGSGRSIGASRRNGVGEGDFPADLGYFARHERSRAYRHFPGYLYDNLRSRVCRSESARLYAPIAGSVKRTGSSRPRAPNGHHFNVNAPMSLKAVGPSKALMRPRARTKKKFSSRHRRPRADRKLRDFSVSL